MAGGGSLITRSVSQRVVSRLAPAEAQGGPELTLRERQVLDSLLEYGPSLEDAAVEESGSETFVVVPRPPSMSPWSAVKATTVSSRPRICSIPSRKIPSQ